MNKLPRHTRLVRIFAADVRVSHAVHQPSEDVLCGGESAHRAVCGERDDCGGWEDGLEFIFEAFDWAVDEVCVPAA
jgi:hypothetical protein